MTHLSECQRLTELADSTEKLKALIKFFKCVCALSSEEPFFPQPLFQSNGAGTAVTLQLEYIIPQQPSHQEPLLKIPSFIPDYLFTYSAVRRMKLTQQILLFHSSQAD